MKPSGAGWIASVIGFSLWYEQNGSVAGAERRQLVIMHVALGCGRAIVFFRSRLIALGIVAVPVLNP